MKKTSSLLLSILTLGFFSCEKKETPVLNMDVTVQKTSFQVGEEVVFYITGNPDQLTFFSGEEGHKYIYRERTNAEPRAITVDFATNRRYGSDAQQPNSLRFLVSQNFSGIYQPDAIVESEWVDITDAFTLSPSQSDDNTYVPSGTVDLSALSSFGFDLDPGKLTYFAFKYTGTTGSTQPRWWINTFNLITETVEGIVLPIATMSSAGWGSIGLNDSPVSWVYNANGLRFQGGGATVGSNLVWAISASFDLTSVTPDSGVALKNMSTRMDSYSHVYETPGTYEVTFVGSNINIYGGNTVVKTITLEITGD